MSVYSEYTPLRNFLRNCGLTDSLEAIWAYSIFLGLSQRLPAGVALRDNGTQDLNFARQMHPWEMDVLAREVILNADTTGRYTLRQTSGVGNAINLIRQLDDEAFMAGRKDGLLSLQKIAHKQFPWQINGPPAIARLLKVFGHPLMNAIVHRETGMNVLDLVRLSMALQGHFLSNPGLVLGQDYSVIGVERAVSDAFIERLIGNVTELRQKLRNLQRYDEHWLYTWNPLEQTPLIRFDSRYPERVYCPIPRYLGWRTGNGLFFDLCKSQGFSDAYGEAFETYIGDVLKRGCPPPTFDLRGEQPYGTKSKIKHGPDWILSDATGHLFVEAKTKRLKAAARFLEDMEKFDEDLGILADAIAQHYRNVKSAIDGKSTWQPDGKPVFMIIVTLEDWMLLSPDVWDALAEKVRVRLAQKNLSPELMDQIPFIVASAHEFELAAQVIGVVGIGDVMGRKTTHRHRKSMLGLFVTSQYKQCQTVFSRPLFPEEIERLSPPRDR